MPCVGPGLLEGQERIGLLAGTLTYLATTAQVVDSLQGLSQYCPVIIALPLFAFLTISLLTRHAGKASAFLSIAALASSFVVSLLVASERLGPTPPTMDAQKIWLGVGQPTTAAITVGILVDNLSVFTSVMVSFVATMVAIYSYGYMSHEIEHFPTQGSASLARFYGYLSLFTFSMLGLVFSNNLLQTYIFWELVGVSSYFLIGFWYFKKSAAEANKKSFVVTKFADLLFLLGILAVGWGAGTFRFTQLDALDHLPWVLFGSTALPLILITFGPLGKSAQFPLHIWLPDAMEGPTPVSALIHAATMVAAGIYLVARMFGVYQLSAEAAFFVAAIGAVTALLAALIAVVQNDIKKVLAYSTISQLGFMLAALGSGAYTAGLFHLFTHAFFKSLLFLGAGAVIVACHTQDIWRMGGLRKALPRTHFAFLMGCLALAGVPPFAGFWSKDEILSGAYHQLGIFCILAMAAFLTAFYVTRVYCVAFWGPYRGDDEPSPMAGLIPAPSMPPPLSPSQVALGIEAEWTEEKAQPGVDAPASLGAKMELHPSHHGLPQELPAVMVGPLLILSLFAIGLGFIGMPNGLTTNAHLNIFETFIHHSRQPDHAFHPQLMLASIGIALAGVGLSLVLFAKNPEAGERKLRAFLGRFYTALAQKLYLDHIWAWLLAKTMYLGARIGAWIDDELIDGVVRSTSFLTRALGEKLRRDHTGEASDHLLMLVVAILLMCGIVAILQPDFALSPAQLFQKTPLPPGGLTP